ncbi:MAG: hypothetical protein VXX63_01140 [Bacteroidota bacterium]|nr:hypothetical protein [Bacteroidota bacterium]
MNKLLLIQECIQKLSDEIKKLKDDLDSIEYDMHNETKSSAGDKYEISREMMQQEREKLMNQINLKQKQKTMFLHMPSKTNTNASLGALVITQKAIFFISQSIGKIQFEDKTIFCLSIQAPITKMMLNKKVKDAFEWNNNAYTIHQIE